MSCNYPKMGRIESYFQKRRLRKTIDRWGSLNKCPWCKQCVQDANDKWNREVYSLNPLYDIVTCGVCKGTSLWRFEMCPIFIGPLDHPSISRINKKYIGCKDDTPYEISYQLTDRQREILLMFPPEGIMWSENPSEDIEIDGLLKLMLVSKIIIAGHRAMQINALGISVRDVVKEYRDVGSG